MEWIDLGKFAASLVLVLCLMGGLALILRYIDQKGGPGQKFINAIKDGSSGKRMMLVERLVIDRQKSALILRIDDREYLVISGPNGDTVVESIKSDGTIVSFERDQAKNNAKSHSAKAKGSDVSTNLS